MFSNKRIANQVGKPPPRTNKEYTGPNTRTRARLRLRKQFLRALRASRIEPQSSPGSAPLVRVVAATAALANGGTDGGPDLRGGLAIAGRPESAEHSGQQHAHR